MRFKPLNKYFGSICLIPEQDSTFSLIGVSETNKFSWDFNSVAESDDSMLGTVFESNLDHSLLSNMAQSIVPVNPKITASCIIKNKLIALGLKNGDILIHSLENLLTNQLSSLLSSTHNILRGHCDSIECIVFTETQKQILVSGGKDCTIRLWNLETYGLLKTFSCHSDTIYKLIPLSKSTSNFFKVNNAIISIGSDFSVSVIDVEELRVLNRFIGMSNRITTIFFKIVDEIVGIYCSDGNFYVWQIQTGHLDRIESESSISSYDKSIHVDYIIPNLFTIENTSVLSLVVDVERLICNISEKNYSRQDSVLNSSFKQIENKSERVRASSSPRNIIANYSYKLRHPHFHHHEKMKFIDNVAIDFHDDGVNQNADKVSNNLLCNIISSVLLWGLDSKIDDICITKLGFIPTRLESIVSAVGVDDILSIPISTQEAEDFTVPLFRRAFIFKESSILAVSGSSTLTANRLMYIVSLLKSFSIIKPDLKVDIEPVLSFYVTGIHSIGGPNYILPSFSALAKYFNDPILEIQESCREIFKSTFNFMNDSERLECIDYWIQYLPSNDEKDPSKSQLRATIILGLMCTEDAKLISVGYF